MKQATGTFTVSLVPLTSHENQAIFRRSIDKVFTGDLQGSSVGEMLAAMGNEKGSAGYVAMERFTGSLAGHAGSFVLQHSSTMTRGVPAQSVSVVPDSGTDGLAGLRGSMVINIEPGVHHYVFDHEL
jgi:hypothetical protein